MLVSNVYMHIAFAGWNLYPPFSKRRGGTDPTRAAHHTAAMYMKIFCEIAYFSIEEVYVEITHYVNCLVRLTKSLESLLKIRLKALWRVMLPVDYSTNNIAFLFFSKRNATQRARKALDEIFSIIL